MHKALEIAGDSSWYLHEIDLDNSQLLFFKVTANELSAASFLDKRFSPRSAAREVIPIDDLAALLPATQSQPRYIFHTAFCCSTLLARCVDFPSATIALKEPQVLMTLANYKRTRHQRLATAKTADEIYRLVSWLLFRPITDDSGNPLAVVVKPTNTVNNIIAELLSVHPTSRALLLHSDLESFLISLIKKGEEGRAFGRNLFNIFQMDSAAAQQMQHNQLMRMTDMQIGAVCWHLQLEHFLQTLDNSAQAQSKTLHCDRLLASPPQMLAAVIRHLELYSLQQKMAEVLAAAPLTNNAKSPGQAFSAEHRKNEYLAARKQHAASLDVILPWAQQLRFKYPFTAELSAVLRENNS